MTAIEATLVVASFLCSLVAGLLFTFAIVVMPGIAKLDDEGFLRAFQAIDGIIQRNQPLFVVVWIGSVLALLAAAVLGLNELNGTDLLLVLAAALVYILGVQAPTVAVNLPLNNMLQRLDVAAAGEAARTRARRGFESRWNRWNTIRAVCSILTSLLLMIVLLGM